MCSCSGGGFGGGEDRPFRSSPAPARGISCSGGANSSGQNIKTNVLPLESRYRFYRYYGAHRIANSLQSDAV